MSFDPRETEGITNALRRAAKRALELGLKTGTPVYVMENGKIVDLTKRKQSGAKLTATKARTTRTSASSTKPNRSSR